MGWFRRGGEGDGGRGAEPGHEEPVELDLGLQKEWEVEMTLERLRSAGLSPYLVAQREAPEFGDLGPKHCRLYVRPDEELRVRAELASAGFL
ncbi:MAG TPA: hypothetical protein VNS19_18760 [Acidimicrobiales bacterium]|nr:hypothetical protein [Acidimicrobiales bacterium]